MHTPLVLGEVGKTPRAVHAVPAWPKDVTGTAPFRTAPGSPMSRWPALGASALLNRWTPAPRQKVVALGLPSIAPWTLVPGGTRTPVHEAVAAAEAVAVVGAVVLELVGWVVVVVVVVVELVVVVDDWTGT